MGEPRQPTTHHVSTTGRGEWTARRRRPARSRFCFRLQPPPPAVLPPVIDLPEAENRVVVARFEALQPPAEAPHRVHRHSLLALPAAPVEPAQEWLLFGEAGSSREGRQGGGKECDDDCGGGGDGDGNNGSGSTDSWRRPAPEDAEAPRGWEPVFRRSFRPLLPFTEALTSLPGKFGHGVHKKAGERCRLNLLRRKD